MLQGVENATGFGRLYLWSTSSVEQVGPTLPEECSNYVEVFPSPLGRYVVYETPRGDCVYSLPGKIWLLDTESDVATEVASDAGDYGLWAFDGRTIVWSNGRFDVASGTQTSSAVQQFPSTPGRLYESFDVTTDRRGLNLWWYDSEQPTYRKSVWYPITGVVYDAPRTHNEDLNTSSVVGGISVVHLSEDIDGLLDLRTGSIVPVASSSGVPLQGVELSADGRFAILHGVNNEDQFEIVRVPFPLPADSEVVVASPMIPSGTTAAWST